MTGEFTIIDVSQHNELKADYLDLCDGVFIRVRGAAEDKKWKDWLKLAKEKKPYSSLFSKYDKLKKYSPVFNKVKRALFDEFQLESGEYNKHELEAFFTVLIAITRGGGDQSRQIDLYMLSNPVSILNPYYVHFGIHKRLQSNTHFLRGNGWILEQGYNKSASDALNSNTLYSSFAGKRSMNYHANANYLINDELFIQKPSGKAKYLATIIADGESYGVVEYYEAGLLFVTDKADPKFPIRLTYKLGDVAQNAMMIGRNNNIHKMLKDMLNANCLRFNSGKAKNMVFDLLAVDIYL